MKKLYTFPISADYWKLSSKEGKEIKKLCLCAIMMVLRMMISNPFFSIPISENLKITFGYLVTATNSMIVGPLLSLVFGFVLDNVSFMIFPSGTYFFGYTLSSMAGALVYALLFYRTKISLVRIIIAKLTVNLFVNVLMGSLWSAMLYSKGYLYYLSVSLVKNITLLPIEVLLLYFLFKRLVPILYQRKLIYTDKVNLY